MEAAVKAKYIHPYTNFGFRKLFAEETNKNLLIDFLNQLLPEKHKIVELSFKKTGQFPYYVIEPREIIDVYCVNDKGEKFIVEMQKAEIPLSKNRVSFCNFFPIKEQAEKRDWNYDLIPIYCVGILDFEFYREKNNVILKDQYCQIFCDKLTYIFIEMPKFMKTEDLLETHFDKWLYFLKNLEDFENIPGILKEEIFIKGFEVAEIANFNEKHLAEYEESLKVFRDLKAVVKTAYEEGKKGAANG
jgi:predicted transposase/invertase (TIGR01784 family)